MSDQFGRRVGLVVYAPPKQVTTQIIVSDPGAPPVLATVSGNNTGEGLDLSEMQIQFEVDQSDFQTPNTLHARIFNLSDTTAQKILSPGPNGPEYTRVTLQAGYKDGNYGVIFDGSVKQVIKGRLNATDTYVDLWCGDGDIAYNLGVVNATLAEGETTDSVLKAIASGFSSPGPGVNVSYAPGTVLAPITYLRGKVLFGMAKDYARNLARSNNATWNIQNGQLQFTPQTGYLPGEVVVMTSKTGMLGLPRQTDGGIEISCLLNPLIQVGGRIKLDNRSIQAALISPELNFSRINNLPGFSADGVYKVLVAEHRGDTRGNDWQTNLVCLSVDPSNPPDNSVKPYS